MENRNGYKWVFIEEFKEDEVPNFKRDYPNRIFKVEQTEITDLVCLYEYVKL